MDRKTLTLLGAVLLVLGAAAAFAVKRAGRPSTDRLLWSGDASKAASLVFTGVSGRLELVKKGASWEVASPVVFPADEAGVKNLFEKLAHATLSGPLTESQARHAKFGLDAQGALRLQLGGADPLDVYAGKPSPDNDALYVALSGSNAVYEARGLSRSDLERTLGDWVSKTIVAAPPSADVSFSTAPGSKFNKVQTALSDLQADSLEFPPLKALSGKPTLEVRLRWSDKGAAREEQLTAYPEKGGLVPLVKKGEDRVRFLVYPWRLDTFRKAAKESH